jgi:hypothetical protein
MKLFATPEKIRDELGQLKKDEKFRREDRAIISNFFNGAPPLTDDEAQELGFTVNVNHLFGFKDLTNAADQLFGIYTKPATHLEITLDAAPPGKGSDWGRKASLEASRVLRKITSFKTHYQGASGDAAMHGESCFFFPNSTFPAPRQAPLSRLLIPGDASTDKRELTHFGLEAPLSIRDLRWYYDHPGKNWKKANIGKLLEKIYDNEIRAGAHLDVTNPEEMEYTRQQNSALGHAERRRPGVDVTFTSIKCNVRSEFGCPL